MEMRPVTRYTLRRNTPRIMKICFSILVGSKASKSISGQNRNRSPAKFLCHPGQKPRKTRRILSYVSWIIAVGLQVSRVK